MFVKRGLYAVEFRTCSGSNWFVASWVQWSAVLLHSCFLFSCAEGSSRSVQANFNCVALSSRQQGKQSSSYSVEKLLVPFSHLPNPLYVCSRPSYTLTTCKHPGGKGLRVFVHPQMLHRPFVRFSFSFQHLLSGVTSLTGYSTLCFKL